MTIYFTYLQPFSLNTHMPCPLSFWMSTGLSTGSPLVLNDGPKDFDSNKYSDNIPKAVVLSFLLIEIIIKSHQHAWCHLPLIFQAFARSCKLPVVMFSFFSRAKPYSLLAASFYSQSKIAGKNPSTGSQSFSIYCIQLEFIVQNSRKTSIYQQKKKSIYCSQLDSFYVLNVSDMVADMQVDYCVQHGGGHLG